MKGQFRIMSDTSDIRVLRFGVIGCGAVTEGRYLPAAGRVRGIEVTHLADLDEGRARELADRHGVRGVGDHRALIEAGLDAVVVATPPASHARIASDFLEAGIHVLCEKPMAPSGAEARRMVDAARGGGALLSIAMVRRLARASQLLHTLVATEMLGRVVRVDAEEGAEFGWPLRGGDTFLHRGAGGVLLDTGSHIVDLVLWCLQSRGERLLDFRDDALGGVEANAEMRFQAERETGPVEVRIEVSFTRQLRNTIRIYGERGWLEAPTNSGFEVLFHQAGGGAEPIVVHRREVAPARPRSRVDDFVLQLDAFARAVRAGGPAPVPGDEAARAVELIEACRGTRTPSRILDWEQSADMPTGVGRG